MGEPLAHIGERNPMKIKLTMILTALLCVAALAFTACGGSESSGAASGSASAGSDSASAASASAGSSSSSAGTTDAASADEKHDGYFVGKWDLYESDEYTHEQIVQVMEQYANDEETRKKMNEAYGRDNVEFCARFAADGTGEIDTGAELVPFTWEATNEGAVTFTSFNGKETAIHLPVTDGKFTLNGDTYAKAS